MPMKNTASNRECDTCASKPVCVWTEAVRNVEDLSKRFEFSCKYHIPRQSNSLKAKETCEICGKPADELFECEKCHKMVCSNCVDITDMLDIDTGNAEEEVLCKNCEGE